jgi:hypothetical protein
MQFPKAISTLSEVHEAWALGVNKKHTTTRLVKTNFSYLIFVHVCILGGTNYLPINKASASILYYASAISLVNYYSIELRSNFLKSFYIFLAEYSIAFQAIVEKSIEYNIIFSIEIHIFYAMLSWIYKILGR